MKVECLLKREEKKRIPNLGCVRLYGYHAKHWLRGPATLGIGHWHTSNMIERNRP